MKNVQIVDVAWKIAKSVNIVIIKVTNYNRETSLHFT